MDRNELLVAGAVLACLVIAGSIAAVFVGRNVFGADGPASARPKREAAMQQCARILDGFAEGMGCDDLRVRVGRGAPFRCGVVGENSTTDTQGVRVDFTIGFLDAEGALRAEGVYAFITCSAGKVTTVRFPEP